MRTTQDPLLDMRGISKAFPGVQALNKVSLSAYAGQVLALVGENGAGKSTLMKVLSGVHRMDAGEILLGGAKVDIDSPLTAQRMGISIIYQELNLLGNMDVAENIFVGRELKKGLFVDKARQHEEARALLREVGLTLDTATPVRLLSTAQKQMIEVAKALSQGARLIIMDEPTSSLTESETETLFEIIRRLKERSVAVIFISHRMNEIFEISDEIAVMCDGEMVGRLKTGEVSEHEVISLMVGREVKDLFVKESAEIGEVVLDVRALSTGALLKDISFTLRAGEILGFAGLVGAGRSEVMRALFGVDRRASGDIYVRGEKADIKSTEDALAYGLALLPEDRKEQGLILGMTVKQNISLAALRKVAAGWFIRNRAEHQLADRYVESLRIKTPGTAQRVLNLSGGNQQKVVLAKWLATGPTILILDEPTRGIDVGAKKEIHALMSALARQGVAIIMISSELPEILGMSDRIVVMHEGRIKGELARGEASQEAIMHMAVS
ncbi:sugar ABC transporter ATP-binding protein [Bacillota bacterium Meth-B3]|nr:sugar ABC transporter ATP-binding protein [Christensenellaceae bacterium]MEA5066114.1 sugar ABC transporter ATP-binding protein [Eubacteriales bacterium]MEA5070154.1 sugar ABC transporter ATP-binding protein [Christensenellaceae bacterium]